MTGAAAAFVGGSTTSVAVSLSRDSVTGFGSTGASANIKTGSVLATPTGGVSPYTYAWAQKGASAYTWVITSPTAATTDFTCNALGAGTTDEAAFEVTVTDATGGVGKAVVSAFANNGQPYDNRLTIDKTLRTDIN